MWVRFKAGIRARVVILAIFIVTSLFIIGWMNLNMIDTASKTTDLLLEERFTISYLKILEESLMDFKRNMAFLPSFPQVWFPYLTSKISEIEGHLRVLEEMKPISEGTREVFSKIKDLFLSPGFLFTEEYMKEAEKLLDYLWHSTRDIIREKETKNLITEASFRNFLMKARQRSWFLLVVSTVIIALLSFFIVKESKRMVGTIINSLGDLTQKIKSGVHQVIPTSPRLTLPEGERILELIWELVHQHNLSFKRIKELSDSKTAFLAIASHELKTPLTSILGYSEVLLEENLEGRIKEILSIINKEAQGLCQTVERMLLYSQLSGDLTISDINLKEIIREIHEELKSEAERKNLKLLMELPEEDLIVKTDIHRVKIALKEILSNSIKFTEKGYIKLTLKTGEDGIIISVRDTGPGIEEEKKVVIFDLFTQGEEFLKRKHEGIGLGLPLALRAIKDIGEISLKSLPGVGSEFIIKLYEGGKGLGKVDQKA